MRTTIKNRFYKVKNITIELLLLRVKQGNDIRYVITEKFTGNKYRNEIIRGVFNQIDVAGIEFKNIASNLERTLPVINLTMAY